MNEPDNDACFLITSVESTAAERLAANQARPCAASFYTTKWHLKMDC